MPTPDIIGRYHVVKRLGAGAFATVWLAEDDVLESEVAIKVLAENWSHHPDVRARFEQEAQVLRRADSERLVRIHDFGELPDGRPYQVMTYADGGTLQDRLDEGPMRVREALRVAAEIAYATADLHDAGVLHRDLKPSNVLFGTARGVERVLVADLGLAKAIAAASGFTVVAGTPGYMAPEQSLPGGGLDVRADVHAIGAMTYQMLTGKTPRGASVPPSRLRPGLPRDVDRIVLRALDGDREKRWPTAAELAGVLAAAAAPRPRRYRNKILQSVSRTLGILVATAILTLTGGAAVAQAVPQGWTRVTDASGRVSVGVPSSWARGMRDSGWDPATLKLADANHDRPALQVGKDLQSGAGSQLFVGISPAVTKDTASPEHQDCTGQPPSVVSGAGLSGRSVRWTACGAAHPVTYTEIVLDSGVYLQITQDGSEDVTTGILATLRASA